MHELQKERNRDSRITEKRNPGPKLKLKQYIAIVYTSFMKNTVEMLLHAGEEYKKQTFCTPEPSMDPV